MLFLKEDLNRRMWSAGGLKKKPLDTASLSTCPTHNPKEREPLLPDLRIWILLKNPNFWYMGRLLKNLNFWYMGKKEKK